MDDPLVDRRISCPYCAEPMHIVIDLSAGGQSYVEDCQICCQPMQVSFDTDGEQLLGLTVDTAG
ncbi:MAG: CPXCG motif-containing cysteine-rich protein [Gammaproteobacteria bacterium]|nr:CPXCG motif-containing cysteine-rich protein [Gammaproteobacteria bacterium]